MQRLFSRLSNAPASRLSSAPALLACAVALACAPRRTLVIESTPPGAQVRLDDQVLVGETPLRQPFEHYGIRQVTLYLHGYQTHTERIELDTPWYAYFPLDLVTEVLLPFGWRDTRRLRVDLKPGEEFVSLPTLRSVFERADILRLAGPDGPRNLPPPSIRPLERVSDETGVP